MPIKLKPLNPQSLVETGAPSGTGLAIDREAAASDFGEFDTRVNQAVPPRMRRAQI